MEIYVNLWWAWLAAALALGILEILAPGFIFLGFAIGAVVMAALIAIVPSVVSLPVALAVFSGLSLVSWIVLRIAFKSQSSGARRVTHDIND
jgi:membrane protein implicated in regulation of membrane protease activity